MSESAWWANQAELAAVLELKDPDTAARTVIETLARGIQAEFERLAGRQFLRPQGDDTLLEFHNGGRDRLLPRVTPVLSISRVCVDPTRQFGDATLVDADLYTLSNGELWFAIAPPRGRGVVKLEYIGGYETLPDDIRRVFHAELRTEWTQRKSLGISSLTVNSSNSKVSQKYGLHDETRRVLASYAVRSPIW